VIAPLDKSNGWEQIAETFMRVRGSRIGPAKVREWSRTLPRGAAILDLGCGHGVPISQVLIEDGFAVYGVDASEKMIAAFGERFPGAQSECSAAEDSTFFGRTFDGVLAWGLLFLLPAETQTKIIHKAAAALTPGGKFLFTAPAEAVTWEDSLTGRESISLGREAYNQILGDAGMTLTDESLDEGKNHYYFAAKAPIAAFSSQ
jgi:2-polyprenyl-3-methyl-5-hydroxy-6-metoxy-1,4-benzoquinol methylase